MSPACVREARAFLTISSERVSYVSTTPAMERGCEVGGCEGVGGFTCVYALGCQQLCPFDSSVERLYSPGK